MAVCFSLDGRTALAAVTPERELPGAAYVLNGTTGKPEGVVLRHADGVVDARYSPDGRSIVTASEDSTARVWDALSGKPIGPPLVHRRALIMAVFSPDGRRVATACGDGTARVWDARTSEPVSPPLRCDRMVRSVAFSPDGFRLLTAAGDLWIQAQQPPLATDGRPVVDLIREAELLCGSRIDHTGALVPLAPDELLARRQAVAKGISGRDP